MLASLERIVFPVDFSERCDGAAQWVAAFQTAFDAEVTLLHVVEPAQYLLGSLEFGATAVDNFYAELLAESRQRLRQYLAGELSSAAVRRRIVEGDPALRIVEFAHEERAGMIMMPSHGLGPFRRFILGSVTAKVLHDAHVPVWTGTHMEQSDGPAAPPSFRTVVCAVDLGPQSRAALEWAGGLAAKCGARMVAVHAVPGIEARPARYFDAELSQILRKEARERLQALLDGCSLDAQICLGSGEAADVVRYAAERHDAGLVVIGRGSCAGSGGRLRTHAYSIIRQSPCPVVSV